MERTITLLIAAAILIAIGAGIVALFRWFVRLLFGEPKPLELPPEEELARALAIASTPRPVVGTGQWMQYRCEPVFCDPPVQRGEIEVHDPTAPGHSRKTCKFCLEQPRYSGASYRPI